MQYIRFFVMCCVLCFPLVDCVASGSDIDIGAEIQDANDIQDADDIQDSNEGIHREVIDYSKGDNVGYDKVFQEGLFKDISLHLKAKSVLFSDAFVSDARKALYFSGSGAAGEFVLAESIDANIFGIRSNLYVDALFVFDESNWSVQANGIFINANDIRQRKLFVGRGGFIPLHAVGSRILIAIYYDEGVLHSYDLLGLGLRSMNSGVYANEDGSVMVMPHENKAIVAMYPGEYFDIRQLVIKSQVHNTSDVKTIHSASVVVDGVSTGAVGYSNRPKKQMRVVAAVPPATAEQKHGKKNADAMSIVEMYGAFKDLRGAMDSLGDMSKIGEMLQGANF